MTIPGVDSISPARRHQLVRGTSPADGELSRQIPWLRVFVEGAVIVGSILLAFALMHRLALLMGRVLGIVYRAIATHLIRAGPAQRERL